jgi:hypothetical protein
LRGEVANGWQEDCSFDWRQQIIDKRIARRETANNRQEGCRFDGRQQMIGKRIAVLTGDCK